MEEGRDGRDGGREEGRERGMVGGGEGGREVGRGRGMEGWGKGWRGSERGRDRGRERKREGVRLKRAGLESDGQYLPICAGRCMVTSDTGIRALTNQIITHFQFQHSLIYRFLSSALSLSSA